MKRPFLAPYHPVTNPVGIIASGCVYDSKRYHELRSEAIRRFKEQEAEDELSAQADATAAAEGVAEPEAAAGAECAVPEAAASGTEEEESADDLFICKSANDWMSEASGTPDPTQLWYEFWNEGELCCLFADSNAGKSILAVQIARDVSRRDRRILYFDFEMSSKQFQRRYTDEQGVMYCFPEGFMRMEMNPAKIRESQDFENTLLTQIRRQIRLLDAKVVIIDNLGFVCTQSELGDAAGRLMRQLKEIQSATGVSMMVIGHTPKRDLNLPLTQNELAGSKRLFNFFDSVFAIGQSARDPALRYLKQLKVRASEFTYPAESVLTCEIVKEGAFVRFACRGKEPEYKHLKKTDSETKALEDERIAMYRKEGMVIEEIAKKMCLSYSYVQRALKRMGA